VKLETRLEPLAIRTRVATARESVWWRTSREGAGELPASAAAGKSRRTAKLARLEAALLVSDAPLSPRRLAQVATLADATEAVRRQGREDRVPVLDLYQMSRTLYDAIGPAEYTAPFDNTKTTFFPVTNPSGPASPYRNVCPARTT